MTKAIIAGGRDFHGTMEHTIWLDKMRDEHTITEIVCGCAWGADAFGKSWAQSRKIPVKLFPADWNKLGIGAGHIRNKAMADYCDHGDVCLLFPGGKGTDSMAAKAVRKGLTVVLYSMSL